MTARMVKGFCLFTGVSDSHAIFAQNHKPRTGQCQAREAADVRGWTFEVGQKPRRRRKLEQRWHPHPGCLRKSGKERTYREAFLRFGATDEVPKGYATPGVLQKESRHGGQAGSY